jgi:TolB-like protein/DNA-binding winged helix-turn-helix (wHTH) protein/Tfp pilus assembly protein PilF
MADSTTSVSAPVRFGTFEFDARAGELRKNGLRVKLEGQPIQILALLVARPGELVTREELRQQLWPVDTFVDFEHSLNAAVKRLRDALDDSPTTPRFIATLPRRGYRFIYPLNGGVVEASQPAPSARGRWIPVLALFGVAAVAAILIGLNVAGVRDRWIGGSELSIKSLAVLPLRNLTGDKEQEYFADGVTDALTTELAQVRSLLVPSVTSAMHYKSGDKRLPEIARELKVEALVEGSVQRPNERILLNVQLVNGADDRHLWAKSYEVEPRNVSTLLREVARDIIRQTQAQVRPQEQARLERSRTVSMESYDAYLRARYHLATGTQHGRTRAEEYFQQAIANEPNYAEAHAGLARLYAHGGAFLAGGDLLARARARESASKALALDPGNAEAYTALAFTKLAERDWPGAEQDFQHAIELSPNSVTAHVWYAQFLAAVGRFDEALEHADRVRQLAPLQPGALSHAAVPYLQSGRTAETLARVQEFFDLDPGHWFGYHLQARVYLQQGKYQEGITALQKSILLREAKPRGGPVGPNANHGLLAYAYAKAGQRDEALKIVRQLEQQERSPRPGEGPPTGALALAYTGIGDYNRALKCLETGYGFFGAGLYAINAEPEFAPLRSQPRFQKLVRSMGLTPATPPPVKQAAVAQASR